MELEIHPEPSGDEREALARALAELAAEPPDPRGAWWRAGVRESLAEEEEG